VRKGISGIVVVLIGLLGLTGCGGGSSSISKAEYLQQLELVCNQGLKEREEFASGLNEEATKSKPTESQADSIRGLMAVYKGTTEEIADIGVPEQGQKQAEELVQAREEAAAKVDKDPLSGVANSLKIFAKATKIAEELEVASCAK
jgi:hypothetical protein